LGSYRGSLSSDWASTPRFWSRFEDEVDPGGILSAGERQRRAEAARKAYFARMALKSAKARAKKRRG